MQNQVKMNLQKERMQFFNEDWNNLISQSKNEVLKSLLKDTKPSEWTCKGASLLCSAIFHNNLDFLQYLIDIGFDVNIKAPSSSVPLLLAVKSNNYEAIKILLDADADVSVIDYYTGKNALVLLMNNQRKDIYLSHLTENFKRFGLTPFGIAQLLIAAELSFQDIMSIRDIPVKKAFLNSKASDSFRSEMINLMSNCDFENVELLLRYGNDTARKAFYENLSLRLMNHKKELYKAFIARLLLWDVIDNESDINEMVIMFKKAKVDYLQILIDYGIDVYVKAKHGIDLRLCIFGNKNVDAFETLRIDVNATAISQITALHYAVEGNIRKNVKFLLDFGVDVNGRNKLGNTPLLVSIMCNSIECGQLLLEYGAKVQVVTNNGMSLFEFAHKRKSSLLKYLIASIAITNFYEHSIDKEIMSLIYRNEAYQVYFESCCFQQLLLKNCKVIDSITLRMIFDDKTGRLDRFMSDQNNRQSVYRCINKYRLHPLYTSILKMNAENACNKYIFKSDIAQIISEKTGKLIDFDHLAVRNISKYLNLHDINQFIQYTVSLD